MKTWIKNRLGHIKFDTSGLRVGILGVNIALWFPFDLAFITIQAQGGIDIRRGKKGQKCK